MMQPAATPGPIDAYLDALLAELRVPAAAARRILAETEEHLRDSARALIDGGMDEAAAEAEAVARFGPARLVARGFAARRARLLPDALTPNLAVALLLLAATGLLAIGASGLLAAALGAAFGKEFVAGDAPGVTYTAARCAEYQALVPAAATCDEAAIRHHFDEITFYRLDAGVLGLLLGVAWLVLRRRYPLGAGVRVLPRAALPIAGTAIFAVAALATLLPGTSLLVFAQGRGAGNLLSAGAISAGMLGLWARALRRELRDETALASR